MKLRIKLLSIFLAVLMIISIVPFSTFAAMAAPRKSINTIIADKGAISVPEVKPVLKNETTIIPNGDENVEADLEIGSLEELIAFRDSVNAGNTYEGKLVKLTADIDLTGITWTPIGTSNYDKTPATEGVKMFAGDFDGGNHTITGLSSNGYVPDAAETGSTEYSFGLFGYVYGANISNVKLANVDIDCGTRQDSAGNNVYGSGVAALIGYYFPEDEAVSVIENCHVLSGTVKASNNMGGLIGHMDSQISQPKVDITIKNCSNAADVTTEAREAGGILGLMNSAREGNYYVTMSGTVKFENCVNTGAITSLGGGAPSAGGILGRDHNQAAGQRLKVVFDGCKNSGTITVTANGETHAAGIGAGFYSVGAWLIAQNCENTGDVVVIGSGDIYAGGLISYGGVVELINSTSTGTVTGGTGNKYVGNANSILFLDGINDYEDTVSGYTYYLNGGVSHEYSDLVDDAAGGGNFHLVENAYKDGAEFLGWYDNPECTGDAYTTLNKSVKTYYAKWKITTIYIYDWEDLKELDALVESGDMLEGVTVKLMNDIDLYEMGADGEPVTFNPIGANQAYFKGTFDGQGYTIKNMYQSGWALGYDWYNYGTIGLFAYIWNATIKNVTIENAECFVEGGNVAAIAGSAWGNCTFENITVKNCTYATYNNRAAGIVGYTGGGGTMTFKDITVDEDTVIAGLWGSFDSSLGGVVGSIQDPTKHVFENVTVACRLDAYNDVTAAYKYYAYRMCGMLIGRIPVDSNNQPILDNVTIGENVVIDYSNTPDYSYACINGSWQRVEAGYAYDGADITQDPDAEVIYKPFNSMMGGQQYGSYGQDDHEDIVAEGREAAFDGDYFTSLEVAIKAADGAKDSEGNVIPVKLMANCDEDIVITDSLNLDLNGYEFTGNVTTVDGYKVVYKDGIYTATWSPKVEVATKDELNAAIADACDCTVIVLTADIDYGNDQIVITKSITIDLNGKTITGTDNATGSFALITNKGELTITGNGTITLVATNNRGWNAYSSVISNTVGGKLIVDGGTIEHLGGTDMAYAIDNLTNGKGTYAETVINGGTVKSTYRAIRQFLNGVEAENILTVNGGTIEGTNKAIWMQDPSKNANSGKLTVGENAEIVGDIYLSVTEGSAEWPVEVSIAASAVEGEVLTSNVPEQYIVAEANGTWGKVNNPAYGMVAKVGDNYYKTLAEAFAAVNNDNETVVILSDVTEELVGVYLRGNIVGDGVTITLTNSDWVYCPYTFVIGEGVTLKTPALFYYAGGATVKGTLITDAYYQRYAGTKLYVEGTMTVTGETFILRYTDGDANAGIYVNGGTLNASVIYFYQGMISATNGTINVGTYWQTNETDGQGSTNLVLDNSTLNVTVYDHPAKATGNSTVTLKNGSKMNCENGGFTYGEKTLFDIDSTSTIIGKGNTEVKLPVVRIGGTTYATLQDAINAVKNGETIVLLDNIAENVTLTEKTGLYYTIDGNGKTMTGTISVNSLSDTEDNRRITIKDINFVDTTDANVDFISSVNTNHYPRLTVEGCTFTGSGNDGDVALRLKSSHSVIIKDCTGTGLHSFLQNTSGWNLTIENVTVTDSKGGLALGTVQGVTVKGCNITARTYGIRMDAQYNNNAVIESNTINAFIPVVVRKAEVASTVTFTGTNTMTATNTDGLWCAIGTSEYEENGKMPSDPTGKITVTLADSGLNREGIYSPVIALDGEGTVENPYLIKNVADFIFFAKQTQNGNSYSGKVVKLAADIDFNGANYLEIAEDGTIVTDYRLSGFSGTFDGGNYTIKNFNFVVKCAFKGYIMMFSSDGGYEVIRNLKIENVNVNVADITGQTRITALANRLNVGGKTGAAVENVHIKNYTINCTNTTSSDLRIGGFAYFAQGSQLVAENCSIENFTVNANSAIILGGAVSIVKSKCDFINVDVINAVFNIGNMTNVAGGFTGQTQDNGTGTTFTDCDVNVHMNFGTIASDIGGFVASIGAASQFYNCTTSGTINVTGATGGKSIGGFVGDLGWNGMGAPNTQHEFNNCVADVDITAPNANVGGFIGDSTITGYPERFIPAYFNNCKAKGDVKTVNGVAGGFAGRGDRGTFNNCSASGDVAGRIAGGFWGELYPKSKAESIGGWTYDKKEVTHTDANAKSIVLEGIAATGEVTGTEYEAGFIGYMKDIYVGEDGYEKGYATPVILNNNEASGINRYNYSENIYKVATKAELNAALAAAKDGDAIILTADIDYGTDQLAIAKAITLDLGGYTLTTRNAWGGMSIKGNATVKNGTIVHASNTAAIKVWNAVAFENLVIDVQGKGDANKTIGGIVLQSGSTTHVGYIKNVTITGAALTNGIETYNCGDATENVIGSLENVNIDALGTAMLISAPVGTATGCTFKGGVNAVELWIKGNYSATLTLKNSTVEGGVYAHDEFNSDPTTVNNGTLSLTVDKATTGADDITVTIARAENLGGVVKEIVDNAQAKVNDTYYATFEEAFAAAKDGDTITLLADIAMTTGITNTKKITLDLNGKTITGTDNATGSFGLITNKGELTITGNGKITLVANNDRDWNAYSSVISNTVGGKLIVESGTIEHLGGTDMAYAIDNLTNGKGTYAETVINGGTVKSTYRAIRQFLNGVEAQNILTVNGGTIEGTNKAIWMQDPSKNANTGTLTVGAGATINGDVYLTVTEGSTEWPVEVSIAASAVNGEVLTSNVPDGYFVENNGGTFGVATGLKGKGTATDPYQIGTLEDLIHFRDSVNAGETRYNAPGVYVVLTADIDLASVENWAPIGNWNYSFDSNFDGQGHKIMNLKMIDATNEGYIGFFGITANNTIKNFIIENVTIESNGQIVAAAIAYPYYTIVSDITVCGNIAIKGGNYTAGVLGYTRLCEKASNLTVSGNAGSYITGAQVVGGIIADIQMNHGLTADYSNFSVSGVAITGTKMVGGISGIIATQTLNGATVKNVTIKSDDSRVGIVAGAFGGTATIANVTAENVTGATVIVGSTYDGGKAVEAKVGDTYYATLQAAINNANGEVVTLLAPITVQKGEELVIDLKGQTVSVVITEQLAKSYAMITNKGTLTINDTVGGGKISLGYTAGSFGYGMGLYTISNEGGTLTINGGRIENLTTVSGSMYDAIDNNSTLGNTYLTINGGEIYCGYLGIRQFANSTTDENLVTVNGGKLEGGNSAIWIQNPGSSQPKANVVITDGYVAGRILAGESTGFGVAVSDGTFTVAVPEAFCAEGYIPTKNADGTYGVKLGKFTVRNTTTGVGYETLAAAIAAAQAGETIELLADVSAAEVILINKSITINGNGYNVTSSATRVFRVTTGNVEVTLNDVNMVSTAVRAGSVDSIRGISIDASIANVKLTLNNCSVDFTDASANDWSYAVNVSGNGTGHTIIVNGGTYEGANVINANGAKNTVVVKNATLNSIYLTNESYGACIWVLQNQGSTVEATGNTFNGNNAVAFNLGTGTALTESGNTDNTKRVVAKIGNNLYTSLADAFAAAQDGDTITLLYNITLDTGITNTKKVTLDLGGKTITGTDNSTGSFALITNKGELTITGNGKITLVANNDRDWNAYSSVISNTVGGKLIVDGGTIEHLGGTDMAYAIDNLTNGKGTYAETIINGGLVKSTYRAIRQFLNGVEAENILTVNGGTIEGTNKAIWMQDPSKNANSGKLTVGANAEIVGDIYLSVTEGSTEWPVDVSISAEALKAGSTVISNNVPAGYAVENSNGIYGVINVMAIKSATLLYEDMIQIRYKFLVNYTDAVKYGMLVFGNADDANTLNFALALQDKELTGYSNGDYYGYTDGIAAKNMGDSQFVVGYAVLSDGTVVYTKVVEYSPRIYAQRMVSKTSSSAETKALCNALMQYGAAAQVYFNYNTDNLMNAGFETVAYDAGVLGENIFSVDKTETNGFTAKAATLLFDGAITYRIKYAVNSAIADKELYVEYAMDGIAKTGSVELKKDGSAYYAYISGIAGKDMDEKIVIKPYYLDDNGDKVYGAELVYSGYEYCRSKVSSTTFGMADLAKAFAMYIDAVDTAIKAGK